MRHVREIPGDLRNVEFYLIEEVFLESKRSVESWEVTCSWELGLPPPCFVFWGIVVVLVKNNSPHLRNSSQLRGQHEEHKGYRDNHAGN